MREPHLPRRRVPVHVGAIPPWSPWGRAGWPHIPNLAVTRGRATPPQADGDARHYGLALFGIGDYLGMKTHVGRSRRGDPSVVAQGMKMNMDCGRRPHPSLLPEGEGEVGSRGNEMTRYMQHLESNGMNS